MTRRLVWLPTFLALVTTGGAAQRIRLPAGLAELEQRAVKDSNDAAAHYNVALAYWNAKRYADAERALHQAVAIEPKFAPGYLALSYLPYARHTRLWEDIADRRVPEALEDSLEISDRLYRRAFLIDPLVDLRVIDAVRPRSTAFLQALEFFFGEPFRDYIEGLDLMFTGRYQDAFDRLSRVVLAFDRRPGTDRLPASVLLWHGLAAAQLGKHDDAVTDLQTLLDRALKDESGDSLIRIPLRTNEYRYILANIKQRAGNPNEAITLYREALAQDVGLYMAHVQLAAIYDGARMWDQATQSRRNAINANPDDPSLLLDLGMTLAKAARWTEADSALRQAQDANPRDARVPYYLGIVEQQLAKPAEARAAFTRFLAIAPSRYERQIADAKVRLAALP